MKQYLLISSILVLFSVFCGCNTEKSEIQTSVEMEKFLKLATISADSTDVALERHGVGEAVKLSELSVYDLSEPIVVSRVDDCYTVEFSTGELITKVFKICWTEDKITNIEDLGIKQE